MFAKAGTKRVEYVGIVELMHGGPVLDCQEPNGEAGVLLVGGSLIPGNWKGCRVRVVVEIVGENFKGKGSEQ